MVERDALKFYLLYKKSIYTRYVQFITEFGNFQVVFSAVSGLGDGMAGGDLG